MKALPLLAGVAEIKRRTRDNVIKVPGAAVVLPTHAVRELRFDVRAELLNAASEQLHRPRIP